MPGRRGTAGRPGHGADAPRIFHRFRTACMTAPTSVTLTHAVASPQHSTTRNLESFDLEILHHVAIQCFMPFDTAGIRLANQYVHIFHHLQDEGRTS